MSKPPPKAKLKGAGASVAALAIAQAKKALENPETRKAIADQGKAIAGSVKTWQRERSQRVPDASAPSDRFDVAGMLAGKFGQGKLEQRIDNLRTSVVALGEGRPELAEALAPVTKSVDQLAVSLEIAGSLPIVKRKGAHRQIDDALDDLEVGLFQASLSGSADS